MRLFSGIQWARSGVISLATVLLLGGTLAACGSGLNGTLPKEDGGGADPDGSDASDDSCAGDPSFVSGQNASLVIGQEDFSSGSIHGGGGGTSAFGFDEPYGNPEWFNGTLYLPDPIQNRVLGYPSLPTTNGESADFVIGQSNLTSSSSGSSASRFTTPLTVQEYGGKFYLLDSGNHRLLEFSAPPSESDTQATRVVVGVPDLAAPALGCSSDRLRFPESFVIHDGKLLIADTSNHRVLIWNELPSTADTPADRVLGQSGFDSCDAPSSPSASTLDGPVGISTDGESVLVADVNSHRILGWSTFPSGNNANADFVLGQTDFTSTGADSGGISARSLESPMAMTLHSGKVYVSDSGNNRVLIWNSIPTTNFEEADVVLGQASFTSDSSVVTRNSLPQPTGLLVCGNRLIVGQAGAFRYSVFEGE